MTETLHIYGPIGEGENTPPRIGAFLDDNAGVIVSEPRRLSACAGGARTNGALTGLL